MPSLEVQTPHKIRKQQKADIILYHRDKVVSIGKYAVSNKAPWGPFSNITLQRNRHRLKGERREGLNISNLFPLYYFSGCLGRALK